MQRKSRKDMQGGSSYAATIGFFDGVHQGHRFLIDRLCRIARERGMRSMVITFARHPRQVLQTDWQPQLLSTLDEKRELLRQTGVDRVEVLQFDVAMSELSAHDFMQQVLKERLGVELLLTGYDNRFGHHRAEGFDDYVNYGRELGIEVMAGEPLAVKDTNVSSSRIRKLLQEGNVADAALCLGHPYPLSGCVVHGEQIGRQLGFPTANLALDDACKLIPERGVYAVSVSIEGDSCVYGGMMNIGRRPTFEGHHTTLEVHLLQYSGDLYGKRLTVRFIARLREERPFPDRDALIAQMNEDKQQALQILNKQ